MRSRLALLALAAGCSWTLPEPDVRLDARADVAADVRRDAPAPDVPADDGVVAVDTPVAIDTPPPVDRGVATDVGFDLGRPDAGADVPALDLGTDRGAPVDLGAADVPVDRGAVTVDVGFDVGFDVGSDTGEVRCTPNERRSCYPGPPASRGRGYCRDGVETCDATGRWSGTCANAFVPDCTDRRCGSDDCGGTCGTACPGGQVCDDLGHCVVPSCGAGNFTVVCDNGATCPSNSVCTADNLCNCRSGFAARTCAGVDCGTDCEQPNWYCARSSFCGAGAISCAAGVTCPRHATCAAGGQCLCAFGYMAVTCAGDRCTSCPGTDYHCVPVS